MPTDEEVIADAAVQEHEGLLWKPQPDATSTFDEFLEARDRFARIHDDARWSPWLRDDHANELQQLIDVMDQWSRAEPGFRPMTVEEAEAKWARGEEERKAARAEQEEVQQQRRVGYDAAREHARLALLEQEARLLGERRELQRRRNGASFPGMPLDRQAAEVAERSAVVASIEANVDRLRAETGDPETVVDARGELPGERREMFLTRFWIWRWEEVDALRASVTTLNATLEQTNGRAERARVQGNIRSKRSRLDALVAMPPLTAADMCADCDRPVAWHATGHSGPLDVGPCPAWPLWAAQVKSIQDGIVAASARARTADKPAKPKPKPKPEPIAVVPSGRPIAEVITRLTEISAEHPDAIVRRGNANKWEIWPAPIKPKDHRDLE